MRRLVVVLMFLCGCSPLTGIVDELPGGRESGPGFGAVGDVAEITMTEVVEAELATELPGFEAVTKPDSGPELGCLPGEGCFLDGCAENADCQSGWCVEHMGDGVCSQFCQEECPSGWTCKQVADTGPDLVFVCVSDHANLCKPCSGNDNCKGIGGADDACMDYGIEGSFCGGACVDNEDCPWGFVCADVESVDGVMLTQCISETGVCPCTKKSVALGLWTPCAVENQWGDCTGKRVCTEDGLSDCSAGIAAEETCNALDDDCDGDVDEPSMAEGKYVELCDDGNECTADICTGVEGCTHEPLSKGECKDGDSCTVGDHCEGGVCMGSPVQCDDGNPCTDDTCDGLGGCSFTDNDADCDDDDPCTVADECSAGECFGYAISCDCLVDDDCGSLDDGDLCNGTLHCDTEAFPYKCTVKPGTEIACPEAEAGPDAICQAAACDPATGACSLVPYHEGFACDDGNACTVGDKCQGGVCVSGVSPLCSDDNLCTDDDCDPLLGCTFTANDGSCNDGSACTTDDVCAGGECVGGSVLECDDQNVCTDDSCDALAGCVHGVNQADCDDGNECTSGDHCGGGVCGFSDWVDCDDANQCTADGCAPDLGCIHDLVEGECSDGDPCTAGEQCVAGLCQGGQQVDCDDGNPCTTDSCDQSGKCIHTATEAGCSDDNECTVGDHCDAGTCVSSGLAACNDDDVCTTDFCDPAQGCMHTLNQAPCDDEDVCTTGDHCHLGACISSGQLACDDSNPCTDDSCGALAGCVFLPNTAECDDGNACSLFDQCKDGVCAAQEVLSCDDVNSCTDDYCDFVLGCVHADNVLPCDDDDACTANEKCTGGSCGGGVSIVCHDDNVCTDDSCVPATGCVFADNSAVCDDGLACTADDLCVGGTCQPGDALDCDDAQVCTDDSCVEPGGCQHDPVADGTPCEGDKECLAGECAVACEPGNQTFAYTGGTQTFVVPSCASTVTFEVWGAEGGWYESAGYSGKGGFATGSLAGIGGETLYIYVGGKGGYSGQTASAGWNGGGGHSGPYSYTVGGGGASDVRRGGQSLSNRIIVAGGGGACAWCYNGTAVGGNGGGLSGQAGGHSNNSPSGMGGGGTQNSGGSAGTFSSTSNPGSLGNGGAAKNTNSGCGGAGGGGGGYYGGGGGAHGGGGGGGSSYVGGLSNSNTQTGGRSNHGEVTVSWE